MEKVIIVGSGCSGLTAAIYAARANLSPLVLEGTIRRPTRHDDAGREFPRLPRGIDGPQLVMNMHMQAENSARVSPTRKRRTSRRRTITCDFDR
jgi:thioredoxin reductase (NADPH)